MAGSKIDGKFGPKMVHDLFKEVRSTQQFGCNQSLHVVSGRLLLPQSQFLLSQLVMIVANHIEIAWYG